MFYFNVKWWIVWLLLLVTKIHTAQTLTNSGTDFWLGFPETRDRAQAVYWLNIASETATTGNVSIPGTGFSANFTTTAGSVVRVGIPSADADIPGSDTTMHRAIHVTSNDDVSVYAVNYFNLRHEAALILPVPVLGLRYRGMTYSSEVKGVLRPSELLIVAAGDTVVLDITPSGDIDGGFLTGVPYTVTIPPEHVYQIQALTANDDLTGTLIESTNGKKFAVFGGNTWSSVICGNTSDPLMEQLFPTNTWGTEYIALPTPVVNRDVIRIVADQDTTRVSKDGNFVVQLDAGERFTDTITSVHYYTSDKPISVSSIMVSGNNSCANNIRTDPSMILLNPNEQMLLDSITFFAVDTAPLDTHYVQVITRTKDTGAVFLDQTLLTNWTVLNQNTDYSWKNNGVSPGYHRLETTRCGFLAYSKGYGSLVSYAYATGVSLIDLESSFVYSNLEDGSDTLCLGDTTLFEPILRGNPISFSWNFGNGQTSSLAKPTTVYTTPGSYPITATIVYDCLVDTVRDTVLIAPLPNVDLGPDTVLCEGQDLLIDATITGGRYQWNTGSNQAQVTAVSAGKFQVTVTANGCRASDSILVSYFLQSTLELGGDRFICPGDTVLARVDAAFKNPVWQDGTQAQLYEINQPGTYWVAASEGECQARDTLRVFYHSGWEKIVLSDTTVCNSDSIRINLPGGYSSYLWQDGSTDSSYLVSRTGEYTVMVEGTCHSDTVSAFYTLKNCSCELQMPNAFTPNSDGINDIYNPITSCTFQECSWYIYNRWGELIFASDRILFGWDGRTFTGVECVEGTYFFLFEGQNELGEVMRSQGTLTLIR